MNHLFRVSVIIPVYNAAKYVRQAVESVVNLSDVSEVLLIEDKSPDNALEICLQLEKQYPKVKVYQHPNGENRGAGASRNLGIQKATSEYCAFLDADDFCLPHRFDATRTAALKYPDADGFYEAIGYFKDGSPDEWKLFSINRPLQPQHLFHFLLRGTYGHFSTIGITVKKSLFQTAGNFNASLRLHQDAELWLRLAYHGSLRAGELSRPVALARRHGDNRITHADKASKVLFWTSVKKYFKDKDVGILNRFLINRKVALMKSMGESQRAFIGILLKELAG